MSRRITLVRPSDMFRAIEDSMSNVMNDVGISTVFPDLSVHVNIKENTDNYEVFAKIPGYKKEDIEISFHENSLVIEGNIKEEDKVEEEGYVMQEFRHGNFKRTVYLPGKVDIDNVKEATLTDGVLKLTLPKLPEIMPKKIVIN